MTISENDIVSKFQQGDFGTKSESISGYGGGSLFVKIRNSGIEFYYRFKVDGRVKSIKIDKHHLYKSSDGISLEQAREQAKLLSEKKEKENPVHFLIDEREIKSKKKVRKKEEKLYFGTFKEMLEDFKEIHVKENLGSYSSINSAFNVHVYIHKNIINKKAKNITESDISHILRRMIFCDPDNPEIEVKRPIVNRVRSYLSSAFAWAKKYDNSPRKIDKIPRYNIGYNPVTDVEVLSDYENKNGKEQFNDRDLWILWNHSVALTGKIGHMIRLLFSLGGVRQEHLLKLMWSDVYLEDHLYPAHITLCTRKGRSNEKVYYTIPLNKLAKKELSILKDITGGCVYVFAGRSKAGENTKKPMANSFSKPVNNILRFMRNNLNIEDVLRPTIGRIRTTVNTRSKEAKCDSEIFEKIQMHNQKNTISEKHYNKYMHIHEKKEELEKWENYLNKIINKKYEDVTERLPEQAEKEQAG
ncbi:hypothetical protein [Parendozoicomonas sp. Alg238-R29]|uniref:hypothetical protein n=1 Tax=Parendozoicomonas sp. Alg238-R29 TaxID=2993446 RepID=UPI00248E5249|nr:hypothetical protein [Parendozoicomonas sp. Alg238-R29]